MKTGRKNLSVYLLRYFVEHLLNLLLSTELYCADIVICQNNLMSALREYVMCSRCNMRSVAKICLRAAEIYLTDITSNT